MIYVASPYSHIDYVVRDLRYQETQSYVAQLFEKKLWAFSPIVHCHALAHAFDLPTDAEYWKEYNLHMLARADELHVLQLTGWKESEGVRNEVFFWKALKHDPLIATAKVDRRGTLPIYAEDLLKIMEPS